MGTKKSLEVEIESLFDKSSKIILKSKKLKKEIEKAVTVVTNCIENGHKIIIFGNGGSAADAQHMAAEFVGRYLIERKSMPAIALTTDSSILTAMGNDYGFETIFQRQCESLVNIGDVIFAISTSGKSKNVLKGMYMAKKKGGLIIGLCGTPHKKFQKLADILIAVPSEETPRIQESQRTIIHIICEIVERKFAES